MFARENRTCPIWPGVLAEEVVDDPPKRLAYVINSPRAGGSYRIIRQAENMLNRETKPISPDVRARLTTMLVDKRDSGEEWPTVNAALIKNAEESSPLSSEVRADRFLCFMRTVIDGDLKPVPLSAPDVLPAALAHSESTTFEELSQLLKFLVSQGWIELTQTEPPGHQPIFTVEGIRRLNTLDTPARGPLGFALQPNR